MKNQVVKQSQELQVQSREISVITDEIISLKTQANNMMLMYAIEVGRRLVEAKAVLRHGEWGAWLKEKVEFSQRSANRFMSIYNEYGLLPNSSALTNLSFTSAIKLLAVPEEEREEFVQENDVENMTSRELERVIRERDDALARVASYEYLESDFEDTKRRLLEAEATANDYARQVSNFEERINSVEILSNERLQEIERLKSNPEVSQEVIDRLKAEALESSRQAVDAELVRNTEALERAKKAKEKADENVKALKAQIEELEKKVKMSNPNVMEFKALFDHVQKDVGALFALNEKVKANDAEMSQKLKNALKSFFEQVIGRC